MCKPHIHTHQSSLTSELSWIKAGKSDDLILWRNQHNFVSHFPCAGAKHCHQKKLWDKLDCSIRARAIISQKMCATQSCIFLYYTIYDCCRCRRCDRSHPFKRRPHKPHRDNVALCLCVRVRVVIGAQLLYFLFNIHKLFQILTERARAIFQCVRAINERPDRTINHLIVREVHWCWPFSLVTFLDQPDCRRCILHIGCFEKSLKSFWHISSNVSASATIDRAQVPTNRSRNAKIEY